MHLNDLGERAYQAYGDSLGWRTGNGRRLPQWCDLGDRGHAAWRSAASAIELLARDCGSGGTAELAQSLAQLHVKVDQIGVNMSEQEVVLDDLTETFADFEGDVRALLEDFNEADGKFNEAAAAKAAALKARIIGVNTEIGDRDGSEAPAPEPTPGA